MVDDRHPSDGESRSHDAGFASSRIAVDGIQLQVRHSDRSDDRASIILIHGLGDSSLAFVDALRAPELSSYNILIPDLCGFGLSERGEPQDYAFENQLARLVGLMDAMGVDAAHLIGHSMGGDLATLLSDRHPERVRSIINIEGDLTPGDRFITAQAMEADREGRFDAWLREDFGHGVVMEWVERWPSCAHYVSSLQMCDGRAFLESARQIFELNAPLRDDPDVGEIGRIYERLALPKVFCSGSTLSEQSQRFLAASEARHHVFPDASHWVMLDTPDSFYRFVGESIAAVHGRRR